MTPSDVAPLVDGPPAGAWQPLLHLSRVDHGLMLPILLYCVVPLGRPMLGPPREVPETEEFLHTAYQASHLSYPRCREGEANGQC